MLIYNHEQLFGCVLSQPWKCKMIFMNYLSQVDKL